MKRRAIIDKVVPGIKPKVKRRCDIDTAQTLTSTCPRSSSTFYYLLELFCVYICHSCLVRQHLRLAAYDELSVHAAIRLHPKERKQCMVRSGQPCLSPRRNPMDTRFRSFGGRRSRTLLYKRCASLQSTPSIFLTRDFPTIDQRSTVNLLPTSIPRASMLSSSSSKQALL